MPTQLSVLNDALAETGNNLIVTLGEATTECDVATRSWNRTLPILLERHPWNFATSTEVLEKEDKDDNPSQIYDFAYGMPRNGLWLASVWWNGSPINFEIVDRLICTNFNNDQYNIIGKFVRVPAAGAMTNLFFEVLRKYIEAGCLRGLNEDLREAQNRINEAEAMLSVARNRSDQQVPRRVPFRSRMLLRRRGLVR